MAGDIESGVVQQLVAHTDEAAELISGKRLYGEGHIGLADGITFFDPGCFSVIGCDRDGTGTRAGADHVRKLTEDIVLFQGFDQLTGKLIWDSKATGGILANAQCIPDFEGNIAPHVIPECFAVFLRRGRRHRSLLCGGRVHLDRRGCGGCHLGFHLHLVFQPFDFISEGLYIGHHFVVLLNCGSFHHAVFAAVFLKEVFCLIPKICSFLSEF